MKKNVIALLLAVVMASSNVGTVPALAAEDTTQEVVAVEEETVEDAEEVPAKTEDAGAGEVNEETTETESVEETEEAVEDKTTEESETIEESDIAVDIEEENSSDLTDTSSEQTEKEELAVITEEGSTEVGAKEAVLAEGDIVDSGTCGDNATWTLIGTGDNLTLTISGSGEMGNFNSSGYPWTSNSPWESMKENIKTVIIEDGITKVGESAFLCCNHATSVTIPYSVTIIGDGGFFGCDGLTSVTIPDNVTSIGNDVFAYCYGLTSVTIPDNVTSIGNGAFACCGGLTRITIPDNVKSIGDDAFHGSYGLTSIYFRGNAPRVGENAFKDVTTTAYYPANNPTWTEEVRQNYGGTITWVPWDPSENNMFVPSDPISIEDAQFSFRSGLKNDESIRYTFDYDDNWVFSDAASDRYKLMQTSIRVAMAAFGTKDDNDYGGKNIKAMMSKMCFGYTEESVDYPRPETDTIGSAIGLKNIKSPDGTTKSIILVALRGGGYGKEWAGDFRVGSYDKKYHEGFKLAAEDVEARLGYFINNNKQNISNDLRIWITGYSRAAATSNLVAADLINGNIQIEGVDPDEVMAFCFECPRNVIDSNASNSIYHNIVNIVNPIDFVPKVAFNNWGFTRYGVTYYTPSKETTASYAKSYKYQMIWKYQDLCDNNGITLTEDRVVEAAGQASVLDSYFDYLSFYIPRDYYYLAHETTLMDLTGSLLGGSGSPDWGSAVPTILNILGIGAFRPISTGFIIGIFKKSNTGPGPSAHYPELCMSWIDSLGNFSNYKTQENGRYRTVVINCPVDVIARDSEGNIVGRIENEEVVEIENGIVTRTDEDGQKIFIFPQDEEYSVEITARESCEVNYTVTEYSFDSNTTDKIINYKNIEVGAGEELVGSVTEVPDEAEAEYTLQHVDEVTAIEPDEVLSNDDIVEYTVEAAADGNGTVTGGGPYMNGLFARVTAIANEEAEFTGWYVEDECVSTESEYRFAVEKDISLVAKFRDTGTHSLEAVIVSGITDKTYTGSPITQQLTLKDGDIVLTQDTDYTVSYDNNINAGTAKVIITGIGSYTGTIEKTFEITPKAITPTIKLSKTAFTYNKKVQKPTVTVMDGETKLAATDYALKWSSGCTNAGTYKVLVTLKGNYSGSASAAFKINKAVNKISAKNVAKTYSAKAQAFVLGVKISNGTPRYVSNSKSVTVSKAGKVTVKAKFIGKATITITAPEYKNFSKSTKKITVTVVPTKTGIASVTSPAAGQMVVKWKKNSVGTGYQIQYSTSSKFTGVKSAWVTKNTVLSKKITSLTKGKKYYVRMRTYKTVGGVKYYSGWCTVKAVTIKK